MRLPLTTAALVFAAYLASSSPLLAAELTFFTGKVDFHEGNDAALSTVPLAADFVGYFRKADENTTPHAGGWTNEGFRFRGSDYWVYRQDLENPSVLEAGAMGAADGKEWATMGTGWDSVSGHDFAITASGPGDQYLLARGFVTSTTSNVTTILKDGISVSTDGGEIHAAFEPKINGVNVPLDLLAEAMGFKGFNWHQELRLPTDIQAYVGVYDEATKKLTSSALLDQPLVDPDVELPLRIAFTRESTGVSQLLSLPGLNGEGGHAPDDLPFYYNLGAELAENSLNLTDSNLSDGDPTTLLFFDAPRMSAAIGLLSGEAFTFRTELVGYRENGEMVPTGIGFNWSSNAVADSGGIIDVADFPIYIKVDPNNPNLPTIASGGVFNVEFFAPVPEPSTYVLAAFGGVALALMGWRRAKSLRSAV